MSQRLLRVLVILTSVIFYSGCGGESNSPDPVATPDPVVTPAPVTASTLLPGRADNFNHVTIFNGDEISMAAVDNPNHWVQFNNISLTANTDLSITFARTSGDPEYIDQMLLEIHENTLNGTVIGTVDLSDTGDWANYQTKTIALNNTGSTSALFFRFIGVGGVNVRDFTLQRQGVELANQNSIPASPVNACINLGGSLEAPASSAPAYWGLQVEASDLAVIANAGFDTIRLPVKWSDYTSNNSPYTIDPAFFNTVDTIIDWAFDNELKVVLDVHHYDELYEETDAHQDRFIAMWEQIAEHYKDWWDENLIFEIINEPYDENRDGSGMTITRTDAINRLALAKIRESNPDRWVVLGTGQFGGMDGLRLSTPPDDAKTILSLHYYDPFEFTHQGAEFTDIPAPLGATWGSDADRVNLDRDFNLAESLRHQFGKPLLIGEFGVVHDGNSDGIGDPIIVPEARRAPWTAAVRAEAEARGMGWCYWDYATSFKAYQKDQNMWFPQIRNAFFPLQ